MIWVLDTNLLISGLLWGNIPGQLLAAAASGLFQIATSAELLDELLDVLRREKFAARLALRQLTPETAVERVKNAAWVVPVASIPAPKELRDPDDLPVLACAQFAGANLIVSGDKDLLTLGTFQGIPIVTAADALKRLNLPY